MGWLISFSGLDGSGKSTLIEQVRDHLSAAGYATVFRPVRLGFTPRINRIKPTRRTSKSDDRMSASSHESGDRKSSFRKRLLRKIYKIVSVLDLFLTFCEIFVMRLMGKNLIVDRYYWDNWVIYLDKYGEPGLLMRLFWRAMKVFANMPDVAFLLAITAEVAYQRKGERNQEVVEESLETLQRRASFYDGLKPGTMISLDATQTPEAVFQQAWGYLQHLND